MKIKKLLEYVHLFIVHLVVYCAEIERKLWTLNTDKYTHCVYTHAHGTCSYSEREKTTCDSILFQNNVQ